MFEVQKGCWAIRILNNAINSKCVNEKLNIENIGRPGPWHPNVQQMLHGLLHLLLLPLLLVPWQLLLWPLRCCWHRMQLLGLRLLLLRLLLRPLPHALPPFSVVLCIPKLRDCSTQSRNPNEKISRSLCGCWSKEVVAAAAAVFAGGGWPSGPFAEHLPWQSPHPRPAAPPVGMADAPVLAAAVAAAAAAATAAAAAGWL